MDHLQLEVPPVPAILWALLREENLFNKMETEEPEDYKTPFLSHLFGPFNEPLPVKPEEAKVQPPTPLESNQTPEKSRKVKGLKNYSSLPSRAPRGNEFKVPSDGVNEPKKVDA